APLLDRPRRSAIKMALVAAFLATGCSNGSATSVAPKAPKSSKPSGGLPASGDAVLEDLVVSQTDVPSGHDVALVENGDQVDGEVSLDLCSADFPSEYLRVARRQVAVSKGDQDELDTEALLYRDAEASA